MDYSEVLGRMHLVTALIALLLGSAVLVAGKGTRLHKKLGQAYLAMMTPMLMSALLIYDLNGRFNIFHYSAMISSITLIAGIAPLYFLQGRNRVELHKRFMYWSVIGLYMALVAETLTRIPGSPFMPMVYGGSGLVLVIGALFYRQVIKNNSTSI